jgi:hypothetical protein
MRPVGSNYLLLMTCSGLILPFEQTLDPSIILNGHLILINSFVELGMERFFLPMLLKSKRLSLLIHRQLDWNRYEAVQTESKKIILHDTLHRTEDALGIILKE